MSDTTSFDTTGGFIGIEELALPVTYRMEWCAYSRTRTGYGDGIDIGAEE